MYTTSTFKLGRNLVLLTMMPLIFACSKSKFSSTTNATAPVTDNGNPSPTVVQPSPVIPTHPGCVNGLCPQPRPVIPPPRPVVPPPVPCPPPVAPTPQPVPVQPPPVYVPPAPPVVRPQPRPTPPTNCFDYEQELPAYNGPRAMNVWVVMDPSRSNDLERASQLSSLISMYEQNLARSMPITISLITGHSPSSRDSVLHPTHPSLFYVHDNEPAVIRFDINMSQSQRAAAIEALVRKVSQMRTDNSNGISDGGELLTANLLAALKPSNRALAQRMGAFSPGNILNIHFMSDENDICTRGQVPDANVIRNPETGNQTTAEEYARYKHCGMMDVNAQGFSQTLFNELQAINRAGEAKVELTGFIYTGETPVPRDGENEVGHGMLQLIQAMNGRAYDLAALVNQDAYNNAAMTLAGHINRDGNLYARVQVQRDGQVVGLSNIDRERTQIHVDYGNNQSQQLRYRTDSNGNYIYLLGCPVDARRVRVRYCNQQ